jgi:hypothetical protein
MPLNRRLVVLVVWAASEVARSAFGSSGQVMGAELHAIVSNR